MMNRRSTLITLSALAAMGTSMRSLAADPLKVGFVYLGPVGDSGWTHQHDLSRAEMEKNLGNKVNVRAIADVNEGPDAERVARELVSDDCKLIFGASFGYMKPMLKVAQDNPDVKILIASGYQTAANFGGYNAKWHEGGYLAGMAAARVSKSGNLGLVGALPVPDVMWYLNAFTLGARSVNPNATVRVVFINSWFDPPRERDAATALMNQGVDVLTHFTDTPAVATAAEERGVGVISFHSDMRKYAPKNYITGVTHNWGGYYTRVANEVMAGTWKPSLYFGGIGDGVIRMAAPGPRVDKATADLLEAKSKDIASGKFQVFGGPIKDQAGKLRIAAGKSLADSELGSMDWFVEGVVGGK
ncbi:BMP family ABC transporter substrate-binding protein [Variovorax dokdonensis]